MFDLSQDFPERRPNGDATSEGDDAEQQQQHAPQQKKRKRREEEIPPPLARIEDSPPKKKNKRSADTGKGSGAGGAVPAHELNAGIGRSMRRTVGPAGEEARIFALDDDDDWGATDVEEEEDEDVASSSSALLRLRRGAEHAAKEEEEEQRKGEKSKPYWGTYKYRPILGIVPIGGDDGGKSSGVEVALVERPMFEVELPGRYVGDQEWEGRKDGGDLV